MISIGVYPKNKKPTPSPRIIIQTILNLWCFSPTFHPKQLFATYAAANGAVKLGLRPEHLMLSDDGPFKGTVSVFEHLGGESFLHMTLPDDQLLVAKLDGERSFASGEACSLGFRPEHCHVFDGDGSRVVQ